MIGEWNSMKIRVVGDAIRSDMQFIAVICLLVYFNISLTSRQSFKD